MIRLVRLAASASVLAIGMASAANADCGIGSGNVSILGNDFPALQAVVDGAQACATDSVEVSANLTSDHRDLQVAALTADPSQYSVAVVANGSIVPLMNAGLLRPLDDLVEKHGASLQSSQLVRIEGQVMAVAFMANAQHMFYRSDVLEQAGVAAPTTLDEVLAAAEAIQSQGIMEHPVAIVSGAGWNLAQEYVNLYLGHGGSFFEPGSAAPAINNEAGLAALEALKGLTSYSNPDYLTFDSNAVQAQWEAGEVAMMLLWGSRGAGILAGENAAEGVAETTVLAAAPTAAGETRPATTLWWDGFTIAANTSDEDAEASFVAMLNGITPERVAENSGLAVWLAEGYQPTPASAGVIASAQGGAAPYPMSPYMGLMHTALGENLAGFLQGSASAEETLATIEAAYTTAARAQGFLN
ncbi:MAG: extracellular solute-binding protein [Alphaproteobacteria bacterium]|jgi:ABC-type glycerol-3-phosphate transport system substrate-binding protein|nr:extracellular solute-binding protein [Alphaproteobacteria bacterium]